MMKSLSASPADLVGTACAATADHLGLLVAQTTGDADVATQQFALQTELRVEREDVFFDLRSGWH